MSENSALWNYYPAYFPSDLFEPLYDEIKDKAHHYMNVINGKEYPSKRASCFFRSLDAVDSPEASSSYFSYGNLSSFEWSESPTLSLIKETLETDLETEYDYCLVHIYDDGKSAISWHNDKEALNTDVVSVSFGAMRTFRLRRLGVKYPKGVVEAEYKLESGDVFHMLKGCQREFMHTVPCESAVKDARINLTFRKFDT